MSKPRDTHELRQLTRPDFEEGASAIAVVDLFAGCGGLTLGVAQAAHRAGRATDVKLAVDFESVAAEVFEANFKKATVRSAAVEEFFNGALGDEPTTLESETLSHTGHVDILVGGPPCQGHSDLNNHTRRNDAKNVLYARMARAAEVLKPRFVLIENVPTVSHDIADVVGTTRAHLKDELGYVVAETTLPLHPLGVAQLRRRHVMLASLVEALDPAALLADLCARKPDPNRNLRWAIGDLENTKSTSDFDKPPRSSEENQRRMKYLLDRDLYDLPNAERPPCHQNAHSYKSMYGRLSWEKPAQTITSGFGSIGQGRYMHPSRPRALTAHEAARLQGFPDYFDFSAVRRKADLATMIGNAVPPALGREIATGLLPYLTI